MSILGGLLGGNLIWDLHNFLHEMFAVYKKDFHKQTEFVFCLHFILNIKIKSGKSAQISNKINKWNNMQKKNF